MEVISSSPSHTDAAPNSNASGWGVTQVVCLLSCVPMAPPINRQASCGTRRGCGTWPSWAPCSCCSTSHAPISLLLTERHSFQSDRHRAGRGGGAAPGRAGCRVPAVQHRAGAVAGAAALDAEVRLWPRRPAGRVLAAVSAGMTLVALWRVCDRDAATVTAHIISSSVLMAGL
jgi:hypothetical protein